MRIKEKSNDNVISDRSIRDKCVGHYEVLERVKELLLLPGTELMSIEQVADYYEVSIDHIKSLYNKYSAFGPIKSPIVLRVPPTSINLLGPAERMPRR